MPWNNGGRNDGPANGPGPGQGHNPWGGGGGPRRPARPPGGGWSPSGADLDLLIARLQAWLRRLLPGSGGGPRGLALIIIAVLAIWLASGFYRVQPDEQGVVLRFGAFAGTTAPGLNYHLPWPIESVLLPAVTRINRVDVGYRAANGGSQPIAARDVPQESLMLTGDENIIDINFSVFWRISNAADYLFDIRNPATTVKYAAESVMREVIGRTPIQPALAEARARIEQQVRDGTQAILDQYHAGIEVTQVQLQRVDPPAAVIDSFRDVQRANTDAERMRNEADAYRNDIVPRARGDAAAIVAQADAQRQAAIAQSQGESQRFLSVLSAYDLAKDVTLRRLYIETMQAMLAHAQLTVLDHGAAAPLPLLPLTGGPPITGASPAAPPAPPPSITPPSITPPSITPSPPLPDATPAPAGATP